MKKFRNLVIGGIETKIVVLIIIDMLLLAAVFAGVLLTLDGMLTGLTEETTEKQLSSMTGTTAEVIDAVMDSSMSRNTDLEARVIDRMFRDLRNRVQMVGDYARVLLENPDGVPPAAWERPDPSRDGELFVKALFAEGVQESDAADRLGIIANLSDLMRSVCATYNADNLWFSLPEGVTLMTDTVPGQWVEADGSYTAYNAPDRYWYRQAVSEGKIIFTDVETDRRTGELCITCAMPVYSADGTLLGVAGADLYLTEMQRAVEEAEQQGGYLLVVNQNGHVISSPGDQTVFQVLNSEEAADLRESGNAELAALVTDALQGKTDVRLVQLADGGYYMAGVPLETVGWAMITVYSEAAARQPIRTLQANFSEIQQEAADTYRSKSGQGRTLLHIVLAALLVLLAAGAVFFGKKIVKPLNTMTARISELKEGDLEFRMEDAYRTGDEVEMLASSFANLSHKTVEYIGQVQKVTAEKERISTELYVARQIQAGMLPNIFPPYPDRKEFDLYATMNPAKEVGGDFYDYFLIDPNHLVMVMADVSGKGVPAALFMMVSKAILKNNAMMGKSPAEILSAANDTICSNNKMQMFVTVWLGILEISTGRIMAANAGHEYPALCRNGGEFGLYKDRHGFVVGGMEGVRYREYELDLQPGDRLFLYTDGVPEATSASDELFGTDRMIEALNDGTASDPRAVLTSVRNRVNTFVGNAEQFDDLTMLCLEYKGPGKKENA